MNCTIQQQTIIVIPCYNEANRLEVTAFETCLAENPLIDFLFVNDGSNDETLDLLREFERRHPNRISIRDQQPNRGKAEAVRVGMLEAFAREPALVGYWDADLATPLEEIPRFQHTFETHPDHQMVIGSRVKLLGRSIRRDALRHYLGRVAATVASVVLHLGVYDTQCGAKLFRANTEMQALFREPFLSGWVFDVEIIARFIQQRQAQGEGGVEDLIYELPLLRWHDIAGSKLKSTAFLTAFVEIARIHQRYLSKSAR